MIRKITIEQYGKNGEYLTLYVNGILKHGDLTKSGAVKAVEEILSEEK